MEILTAVLWFLLISAVLGIALAVASKFFKVEEDGRIGKICELLPGANCGGCGRAGCAAMAEAIVKGEEKPSKCAVASPEAISQISEIMGISVENAVKMRAQVMCSGTYDLAAKKYIYDGVRDCISAVSLAGGDKLCPNGCIGLGSCVSVCKFDAIKIINGTAAVDYTKCQACGACVNQCPKSLIKLIPMEAKYWVGCNCSEKGALTKSWCEAGCIGCKICEKNCPTGAIKVENNLAKIDYTLCNSCGTCAEKCPRHIIWHSGENLLTPKETANDKETETANT